MGLKTNKSGLYVEPAPYPGIDPILKMNQRPPKGVGYEAARFEWHRPRRYLFWGIHESGKSNLNENVALYHKKIVDIFGSRDNENLLWARKKSPIDDILMVCGDNTEVSGSWPVKKVSELTMKDIEAHQATLTCSAFFSSPDVKFQSLQQLADLFYTRLEWNAKGGDIIYLMLREAMSLLYSKISMGLNEKQAKAALLTFLRELRHFGVSFGADSLRWTGIEKEIRDLADMTIFKQIGSMDLPKEKYFLYKFAHPTWFRKMPKNQFMILRKDGDVATGKSGLLPFHKEEGVNLVKELGLYIEHGESIVVSKKGKVGDKDHAFMMQVYYETESMIATSQRTKRGTGTVSRHVSDHNKEIREKGQCHRCKRVKSHLSKTTISTDR